MAYVSFAPFSGEEKCIPSVYSFTPKVGINTHDIMFKDKPYNELEKQLHTHT